MKEQTLIEKLRLIEAGLVGQKAANKSARQQTGKRRNENRGKKKR